MAQAQLDNILDALKLLPLDLSRSLQLIYQLDESCDQHTKQLDTLQSNLLQHFTTSTDSKNLNKSLDGVPSQLQTLRDKYIEAHSIAQEKLKTADEIKAKLYTYIQRIDEDLEQIAADAPHMLDQYINNEPIFDNYAGQRAASKGLTLANKSPKYNDMSLDGHNGEVTYAPPRRRAANNAIDMMRNEMNDMESDDEYIDTSTNKQFGNLVMTNTVSLNEIELNMNSNQMNDAGNNAGDPTADQTLYCTCQQPSYGEMVGCDNPTCRFEWFHLGCVGLKKPPKANQKWFCYDCTQQKMAQQNQNMMQ